GEAIGNLLPDPPCRAGDKTDSTFQIALHGFVSRENSYGTHHFAMSRVRVPAAGRKTGTTNRACAASAEVAVNQHVTTTCACGRHPAGGTYDSRSRASDGAFSNGARG